MDPKQLAIYNARVEEIRRADHRRAVDLFVMQIGVWVAIDDAKRAVLVATLTNKLVPVASDEATVHISLAIQARKLVRRQPSSVPDNETREAIAEYGEQFRRMEPHPKADGNLPPDDGDESAPNDPAGKKHKK